MRTNWDAVTFLHIESFPLDYVEYVETQYEIEGFYHGLSYMGDICHSVFNEKVTHSHQTTFNYCSIH